MPDLVAAAKRFRAGWTAGDAESYLNAIGNLANAYLDAHPEDEDAPVTKEWLTSIGFRETRTSINGATVWERLPLCCYVTHEPIEWQYKLATIDAPIITRGDVRRLCTALGVMIEA